MVHADSCSGAASFHLHKHIYSSKANTVAGNLFFLRFLVLPHFHRGSWLLRVRALLERSWKWRSRDLHAFLDAVNREIYLEHLIVLMKISILGARYRLSYRMEKNRDISPYRFIVPPLIVTGGLQIICEKEREVEVAIMFCYTSEIDFYCIMLTVS